MPIISKTQLEERIGRLKFQLENTQERVNTEIQFYDYEDKKHVYRFDEEKIISLPDFDVEFRLIIEERGTYTPADRCSPEEFNMDSREVEIDELTFYDTEYGEFLNPEREDDEELFQLVYNLIQL